VDDKLNRERDSYVSKFKPRAVVSDAYSRKLAKLRDQRSRELVGKRKQAKHERLEMQSGFEGSFLSFSKFIQHEGVCSLVEDAAFLIYNLYRSGSAIDYVVSVLGFAKSRMTPKMLARCREKIVDFVYETFDPSRLSLQSGIETSIQTSKDFISYWPRLKSSPLWRKVNSIVSYTTALTLWGEEVTVKKAKKIEETYYSHRGMVQADFVHSVLDLLLFIAERGIQVMKTKTVDPMFHSGSSYEKWYDDSMDIIGKSRFLSNPEAHKIDVHTFLTRLDDLIQKGTSMHKYACELDKVAKGVVRGTLSKLLEVRATYVNRKTAQKTRKAPLALIVEGHSSIGKTTFANIVHYYYASVRGKNAELGSRYTRMPMANFWDGYTSDQWSLLIDDIAPFKPSAITDVDPTLKEILCAVNNAPFTPDKAALEEKGAAPFIGELVVATTNTPDLNLSSYFCVPAAVARRFPYHIRLRPKERFKKNATMIDETKLEPIVPGEYPDWWDIEILAPQPVPMSTDAAEEWKMTFELKTMYPSMNMRTFLPWLHGVIERHNATQMKVTLGEVALRDTKICLSCHLPTGMCKCKTDSDAVGPMFGDFSQEEIREALGIPPPLEEQAGFEDEEWSWFQWNQTHRAFGDISFQDGLSMGANYCVRLAFLPVYWYFNLNLALWVMTMTFAYQVVWNNRDLVPYLWRIRTWGGRMELLRYGFYRTLAQIVLAAPFVFAPVVQGAREAMRVLGELVQARWFPNTQFCILIVGVLVAALAAYKLSNHFALLKKKENEGLLEQGNVLEAIGSKPASLGEPANVWQQKQYVPSTIDIGRHTLSWKGMDDQQVKRCLANNCVFMRFKQPDGVSWKVARCFGLGGQYFLTTNHSIPEFSGDLQCHVIRSPEVHGPTGNVFFRLPEKDIRRNPQKDLVVFRCRAIPPMRNVMDLFIRERLTGFRGPAYYYGRARDGHLVSKEVGGVHEGTHYNERMGCQTQIWWGRSDKPTELGDCGSILIVRSGTGPIIAGIHQLGSGSGTTGAIKTTYEDLMDLMAGLTVIGDSPPLLDDRDGKQNVPGELHPKSPINFMEDGVLDVCGSFAGFRAEPKFKVVESIAAPVLHRLDPSFEVKHCAPQAKGWRPKYAAMVELSNVHPDVSPSGIDACVDYMVEDWMEVDPKWRDQIQIYDVHTALNGVPGLKYVDGIKRQTSAGFPWAMPKEFLLTPLEPTIDYPDHVELKEVVVKRIEELLKRYDEGCVGAPVFRASFKNEPLPIEKAKAGKVRTFMMSCVELTVIMRMYLLSFVRVAQSNHFIFEMAPGMEAQSVEWELLYQFLTQHGTTTCIAGDFRWYDKSMHPAFVLAAFDAIALFLERCGATEHHVRVVKAIGFDIAFAYVDFFGDLIRMFGKNPSGQALTAIVNGIINSLYMRYVWRRVAPREMPLCKFQKKVALMTYGDDNAMGVSPSAPFFNHTVIAETLADIGVTYTMADKESESRPYIPIEEVTFLKRGFRLEPETGTHMAPLDVTSIQKMLMVQVPSSVVSPEVQMADTMRSAMGEYFFHGKSVFEEKRALLMRAADELNLFQYTGSFDTWDKCMDRYLDASRVYLKHHDLPKFATVPAIFVREESGEEWTHPSDHLTDREAYLWVIRSARERALARINDIANLGLGAGCRNCICYPPRSNGLCFMCNRANDFDCPCGCGPAHPLLQGLMRPCYICGLPKVVCDVECGHCGLPDDVAALHALETSLEPMEVAELRTTLLTIFERCNGCGMVRWTGSLCDHCQMQARTQGLDPERQELYLQSGWETDPEDEHPQPNFTCPQCDMWPLCAGEEVCHNCRYVRRMLRCPCGCTRLTRRNRMNMRLCDYCDLPYYRRDRVCPHCRWQELAAEEHWEEEGDGDMPVLPESGIQLRPCGVCRRMRPRTGQECWHCLNTDNRSGVRRRRLQEQSGTEPVTGDDGTSGRNPNQPIPFQLNPLQGLSPLGLRMYASGTVVRGSQPCHTIGAAGDRYRGIGCVPWVRYVFEIDRPTEHTVESAPHTDLGTLRFESGVEPGEQSSIGDGVMAPVQPNIETQQTATFLDSGMGDTLSFGGAREADFTYDRQDNADLAHFLSRPRLISSHTWTPGNFTTSTIDPWSLYLATPEVEYKLNNFAWFRGTLKVKVVINAANFYYGALLLYYTPLPANVIGVMPTSGVFLQISQRPHIWIYPQKNEGGEMTIPFFYPKNYVNITSAAEVATLGTLTFRQFTQLSSANGAVTNSVQLQVYAWMEDVSLFGPTVGLSMQAGDEYGNGPVSAPAAALAHWSEYLSRVPVIGRFARATSIGASAVSHIAKLFGWSNVPVIDSVTPMKNVPFHDLASAHIGEPTSKFTLDPKGELSVDPGIVGLSSEDELSIAHLVGKESYLATGTWAAGASAGALIFSAVVTPCLNDIGTPSAAGTYFIAQTPMSWVSAVFAHWRGDVIFRFKVICSKYHSGRLRIHWDPVSSLNSTADYTHVTYTSVIDLQESDEAEFRVPYMQALPWLACTAPTVTNMWSTTATQAPSAFGNGTITVRVLNNLTAPTDTASCSVLVFVRGAENLEFANPRDLLPRYSFFNMQSGTEPCVASTPHEQRFLTNWGEPVPSVRVLLRRSTLVDRITIPRTAITASDEAGLLRMYQTRLPPHPGYDTTAYTQAKGVETPATTYQFQYTYNSLLGWFAGGFVAMRGGVRWHYNFVNPDGTIPHNITVTRRVGSTLSAGNQGLECSYLAGATSTATTQSLLKGNMWKSFNAWAGTSGCALTNPITQTGVSVEFPMMTNYLFQFANPRNWFIGTSADGSNTDNYVVDMDIHPAAGVGLNRLQVQRYASAGTDFILHFFLNAPWIVYNPSAGSTPV
jgi:hypothetical protein